MNETDPFCCRDIYLLRHGDTRIDAVRRYIGRTDIALNESGREQARWWKAVLANISFSRIICSDLGRTRETAGIIAEGRDITLDLCSELREIDLGEWDGLTVDEVKRRFPAEYEKRGANPAGFRPEGGESFSDVSGRAVPVLEQVTRNTAGGNVLIVGHAGVNRVLLCYLLEMPLSNLFRLGQDFACLNIIRCANNSVRIRALNIPPGNLQADSVIKEFNPY
jgi:alpha-ribazole phosphatase